MKNKQQRLGIMQKPPLGVWGILLLLLSLNACKENHNADGILSPYIAISDLKELHKGTDITLTRQVMRGDAHLMRGVVISSPTDGNNMPNTLVVQGNQKSVRRGITLEFANGAENYKTGDSLVVELENTVLKKINGSLRVTGLNPSRITVASQNNVVEPLAVSIATVLAAPSDYEGVLLKIYSSVLDREAGSGETYEGDKPFKDVTASYVLHTEAIANFADEKLPASATFTCYPMLYTTGTETPSLRFWLRNINDVENAAGALYANFPEGWENDYDGVRKAAYGGTSDIFPSGEWLMPNMYTLNSATIINKNGTWALMMRGLTSLQMNFDLNEGASKFSFYYGAATLSSTDAELPMVVKVEYSQNGGSTWQQMGDDLIVSDQTVKYFFETTLNLTGQVRFRISKDASAPRLFVDDVAVYKGL